MYIPLTWQLGVYKSEDVNVTLKGYVNLKLALTRYMPFLALNNIWYTSTPLNEISIILTPLKNIQME